MNLEMGSLAILAMVGCIFLFVFVFWKDLVPSDPDRLVRHTARRPYKSQ